jgi:hypothetical protein
LTKGQIAAIWLSSIAVLAVVAGQGWGVFEISAEAGGTTLVISGFAAFPVIGTILGLQLLGLLLGFLTKPIATRLLGLFFAGLMIWHGIGVGVSASEQVTQTAERELATRTGVLQNLTSSDFILSSNFSFWPYLYLVAVVLNFAFLTSQASNFLAKPSSPKAEPVDDLPEDLWSGQK